MTVPSPSNPCTAPPQPPILFNNTPESLLSAAHALTEGTVAVIDAIVAQVTPATATFANTVAPFAANENYRLAHNNTITFPGRQDVRKEVREASTAAAKIIADSNLEVLLREDFFALVNAVWKRSQGKVAVEMAEEAENEVPKIMEPALSVTESWFLQKLHARYEENGMGLLSGPALKKFTMLKQRTQDLVRTAMGHHSDNTTGVWLTEAELAGLPADLLSRLRKDGASRVDNGEELPQQQQQSENTRYWVSTKEADVNAVMRYATSERVRRQVWLASQNYCPQNVPLYREIFLLRDETARLLGYPDFATWKTKYKMVGSPEVVDEFLDRIEEQTQTQLESELRELRGMKQEDASAHDATRLYDWDRSFYTRVRRENRLIFNESEISEYFSLDRTLEGIFHIYGRLFGIRFVVVEPEEYWTWHQNIKMFTVWDEQDAGAFLGYLYLDLFPRDGKYPHRSHFLLSPGYYDETGQRHYPSSVVVMNIHAATSDKPALLKHGDLVSLFLINGHAMHNLLSKTRYASFHGLRVDKDFVKSVSMFFQNFAWTPHHLKYLSYHYSYSSPEYRKAWEASRTVESQSARPPIQLPDDLLKKLMDTKILGSVIDIRSRLFRAVYDMQVHRPTSREELEATDFAKKYDSVRFRTTGFAGSAAYDGCENLGFSTFKMILGSQEAGYYVHLLSQIHSYDLFNHAFKRNESEEAMGLQFRYKVLQPGGSQSELETMTNFLGREPNTAAFCQEYGFEL